ncbi:hypothetical protein VA249_29870 [Vibrio alfacsensis]|uniref:hypothetical protein n=1 Tax=Vibrio alfacsensis TaxID=1074311 RepID=UPI001BED6EE9|nr:hypothetical protein [Vibrio alfacsensis]BBM66341.1 hypothetical protein VA249_29870 [Vibrio alfacsensis]
MPNTATVVAGTSGVTSAAMASRLTNFENPSVMKYVIYHFGEYALYLGDFITIGGLCVAIVSALIAFKRVNKEKS